MSGKVVPPGTYKICIEAAYEHSGHSFSSATVMCGDKGATATMNGTQHFDGVQVAFALKGN